MTVADLRLLADTLEREADAAGVVGINGIVWHDVDGGKDARYGGRILVLTDIPSVIEPAQAFVSHHLTALQGPQVATEASPPPTSTPPDPNASESTPGAQEVEQAEPGKGEAGDPTPPGGDGLTDTLSASHRGTSDVA